MQIRKMYFSKKSLPLACGISKWLLCWSHLGEELLFVPQMKPPAWTELCGTHRALDNKKFLDKFFDNVLSLDYLLHLESKVSRDVWVGFFLSRINREARASEDVKAPLQPFGRCKLTSMENGFCGAERCIKLPMLIRLFKFSFSSSFFPFFMVKPSLKQRSEVDPFCN